MKTAPPITAEGMERYLGSGLLKGIGPRHAKKLVGRFGVEAPRPDRVDGVLKVGLSPRFRAVAGDVNQPQAAALLYWASRCMVRIFEVAANPWAVVARIGGTIHNLLSGVFRFIQLPATTTPASMDKLTP